MAQENHVILCKTLVLEYLEGSTFYSKVSHESLLYCLSYYLSANSPFLFSGCMYLSTSQPLISTKAQSKSHTRKPILTPSSNYIHHD